MVKKSKNLTLQRGDVILVPFPFTDLTSTKVRPAVIISADPQTEDVMIAFLSSVVPSSLTKFDFLLRSQNPDFKLTGLKKDSVIKMNKILTISSTLILRRLGHMGPSVRTELDVLLIDGSSSNNDFFKRRTVEILAFLNIIGKEKSS